MIPTAAGAAMEQPQARRPYHREILAVAVLAVLAAHAATAQELPPPPVFPQAPPPPVFEPQPPQPVPAPVFPAAPEAQPVQPFAAPPQFGAAESPKRILKNMFAASLAAMTTTVGGTVLTGLTDAIAGGITSWFKRKPKGQPEAAALVAAPAAPSPAPVFDPATAAQPALPPPPVFAQAPQFFDPQTGAAAAPDPVFAQAFPAPAAPGALAEIFAGLAFEVHAVMPGGASVPVNPATHEFRTGDRFVLHYRPTLPGQMTVFNINPAGIQTQIDRVDLAAGQLAQLGPYEFSAMTGDDRLRLVLSPCSTPELLAATRDIVNVANAAPGALSLAACSPVTRSIRDVPTRDIRKVGVEGTTAFALDPVSASEFGSGQLAPREVTIVFRHR